MTLFLFFFVSLLLPVGILVLRNGEVIQTLPTLLSSAGIALLLCALFALSRRLSAKLAAGIVSTLFIVALLIRFLLGFLYDFSGRGFTGEFFNHISLTSLNIGLYEYRKESIILLVLLLLAIGITFWLSKKQLTIPSSRIFIMLWTATSLVYFGAQAAPEWLLAHAYQRYTHNSMVDQNLNRSVIREQSKTLLTPVRADAPLPIEKSRLQASLPARPLNLILIYLESFNQMLTENDRFPGLTPAIDDLKKRYYSFDNIYSSAYVTIEGIANSQCGTLMNMEYANNSLITREGRLPSLPCLGDILHTAGYQQVFMGGAGLDFAGKGAFLREHGYDELYGVKHWEKLGFKHFANWGLADTELFEQALISIQDLHQQAKPFNLTLLTLGMHIPGFVYDGCPSYTDQKEKIFLNAIHCTDHLLGQFMQALENTDVLEDTVVLVQADHGVFASTDMRTLFANDFPDRRLFTLLALPEKLDKTGLTLNTHAPGSSVDTVASLLDILQISHNSSFIFAQSHFKPSTRREYFLSRRTDHFNGQRIENDPENCTEQTQADSITLPLDRCEKNSVMRATMALNASYTQTTIADNNICELGADISQHHETGAIELKWGNQNLSEQFYWRGSKKRKNQLKGIYAVLMDQQNNVQQAFYYQQDSVQDIRSLSQVLNNLGEQKVLLINNTPFASLAPDILQRWPKPLRKHKIVFGDLSNGQIQAEFASANLRTKQQFLPQNCRQPAGFRIYNN